jgi:hypothetical protein
MASTSHGTTTGRLVIAAGALLAVTLAVLFAALRPSGTWAVTYALAGAFIACGLYAIRTVVRRTGDALHPYVAVTAYYILGWAAGAIYLAAVPNTDPRFEYTQRGVLTALVLGFVSWLCFTAGYAAGWKKRTPVTRPDAGNATPMPVSRLLLPLYATGWLARALLVGSGRYWHVSATPSVSASSTSFITAALAALPTLVLVMWGIDNATKLPRLRLLGFLLELAWYLPTGGRAPLVGVVLAYIATDYYGRGRLPRTRIVVLSVLVVVVVFPAVLAYRGQNTDYQGSVSSTGLTAVASTLHAGPAKLVSNAAGATLGRFVDPRSAAVVFHDGRIGIENYRSGSTYEMTLTSLLPRVIIPSKPDPGVFGNAFGRTYHFTAQDDLRTSITIGQPLEAYWNYGPVGVLVIMSIVGVLYARVVPFLLRAGSTADSRGLYAANLFLLATSPGTILADGFATFAKTVLIEAVAIWVVAALVPHRHETMPQTSLVTYA